MNTPLINGQSLIDSFLLLTKGTKQLSINSPSIASQNKNININELPSDLQTKLIHLISNVSVVDHKYKAIFDGDLSLHKNDHSAADMALIGYFYKQGLSPREADLAFRASKLYREKWDEFRGKKTYGELTIDKVYENYPPQSFNSNLSHENKADLISDDPLRYRPIFIPTGMSARAFVGPKVNDNARLFPMNALSSLVALGGIGKTSLLMTIGVHIAAGKDWNDHRLQGCKVAIFFCEESQEEVSRKFSAITESWNPEERQAAENNLLLVPLLGKDARLTAITRNQYQGSGVAEQIIQLLNNSQFENGLVVLDHMQGFTSGDLNISETATAVCREANKIVEATGSAVVVAAHIGKNNIKASDIEQGFAVGSLAFENATRQMSGMIPMQDEDAKKYGLGDQKKDHVWLGLAKNSYGSASGGIWLKKVFNPRYHTVVYEPVKLIEPVSIGKQSANERLIGAILERLAKYPFTTKNMLDSLAGKEGIFKSSKERVRDALKGLMDSGEVYEHTVTEVERLEYRVAKQVKAVLRPFKATKMDDRQ
jgi:RecA-family ATPase